jgi:hypothetical protein
VLSAADLTPLAAALASTATQSVESAARRTSARAGIDVNGDGTVDAFDLPPLLSRLFD